MQPCPKKPIKPIKTAIFVIKYHSPFNVNQGVAGLKRFSVLFSTNHTSKFLQTLVQVRFLRMVFAAMPDKSILVAHAVMQVKPMMVQEIV